MRTFHVVEPLLPVTSNELKVHHETSELRFRNDDSGVVLNKPENLHMSKDKFFTRMNDFRTCKDGCRTCKDYVLSHMQGRFSHM